MSGTDVIQIINLLEDIKTIDSYILTLFYVFLVVLAVWGLSKLYYNILSMFY